MANVGIQVGNRDVIASGAISLLSNEGATFFIEDLTVRLIFAPGGDAMMQPEVKSSLPKEKELILELHNFSNVLGTTWGSTIGNIGQRPLLLSLVVHYIGTEPTGIRSLLYTLSLGAPVG